MGLMLNWLGEYTFERGKNWVWEISNLERSKSKHDHYIKFIQIAGLPDEIDESAALACYWLALKCFLALFQSCCFEINFLWMSSKEKKPWKIASWKVELKIVLFFCVASMNLQLLLRLALQLNLSSSWFISSLSLLYINSKHWAKNEHHAYRLSHSHRIATNILIDSFKLIIFFTSQVVSSIFSCA